MTNHCGIVLKETEDPNLSRKKRGLGFSARPLKTAFGDPKILFNGMRKRSG
jgi:hypothetical protein